WRIFQENIFHPYERSLVELTLGDGYYEMVLGKVDALRKKVVSVGKEHASLCAKSSSKREAEERLNEGIQKVEHIFYREGKIVDDLLGIAKTLRAMPVISLETPTLCLVGAPNVGKSSLVRVLSTGSLRESFHSDFSLQSNNMPDHPSVIFGHFCSKERAGPLLLSSLGIGSLEVIASVVIQSSDVKGKGISASEDAIVLGLLDFLVPVTLLIQSMKDSSSVGSIMKTRLSFDFSLAFQVCNYPFTTRGILIGHIVLNYHKFQVTDTPGLLKRQYEDRNNLEKLTLAALSHLPTAILYVHDLSGECGTSPADQFSIYKEIRENFTEHLWLDVVSKSDLLEKAPVIYATEYADPEQLELLKYRISGPDGAIHVSVKTEQGLHELKCRVRELLNLQMAKINDMSKNQQK
ncbi:uncharacterized protein LOC129296384, partial [Prosopis cineraria]|uniref:uncharacterized protein LOC129296384 n=1 Tax=Prosopis cineraria TaxID=364024 RepID=UPI00240F846C